MKKTNIELAEMIYAELTQLNVLRCTNLKEVRAVVKKILDTHQPELLRKNPESNIEL